jgi:threonine dehydrogenase-like Zn-dependent dehydrogenase
MADMYSKNRTMRSVVFDGQPLEVHVRDIPKATVVRQTDAVVQVTSAAICGSDLHNYHGVFGSNQVPYSIGHEAMGIVEEVGADVDSVKVGDRVIIPDIPDGVGLDLEPASNFAIALYGEGHQFGNLGGCQGTFERRRIMFYYLLRSERSGEYWKRTCI